MLGIANKILIPESRSMLMVLDLEVLSDFMVYAKTLSFWHQIHWKQCTRYIRSLYPWLMIVKVKSKRTLSVLHSTSALTEQT